MLDALRGRILPLVGLAAVVGAASADTGDTGDTGDSRDPAAGAGTRGTCLDLGWGATCPVGDDALAEVVAAWESQDAARRQASGGFGEWCEALEVVGDPVVVGERWCCYEVVADCTSVVGCGCGGRRLAGVRGRLLPGVARRPGGRAVLPPPPAVARRLLTRWWAEIGAAEVASVPSFRRFARDLQRFGAPTSLVARARRAARDEARHARLAFDLAGRCAGARFLARTPPDLGPPAPDLAAFAAATTRDAAVEELRSAGVLARMASEARVPQVRAALVAVLAEEVEHVVLAWEAVAWAVRVGGPAVRRAVGDAPASPRDPVADWPTHPVLAAWGCPGRGAIDDALARAEAGIAGLVQAVGGDGGDAPDQRDPARIATPPAYASRPGIWLAPT